MTWVRLDDQFLTHPKALRAGKDGRALFVASLCYVAQHELDGRLEGDVVSSLCALADVPAKTARRLVDVGLWDATEEGYLVHDFLDYNPSRAQLDAEREAGARRKKASRDRRKGHGPASGEAPPGREPDVRRGLASASTDPDPVPYPTTSPSSPTTSAVPQPDDGGGALQQACQVLAEREADRRGDIVNRSGWIRSRTSSLVREHAGAVSLLPADSTPRQVLAFLDGSRPAQRDACEQARQLAANVASTSSQVEDWLAQVPEAAHDAFRTAWAEVVGGAA